MYLCKIKFSVSGCGTNSADVVQIILYKDAKDGIMYILKRLHILALIFAENDYYECNMLMIKLRLFITPVF